ncbi:hypothetical protein BH09SUM1_BH09SUM1_26900 [soil metagenome]
MALIMVRKLQTFVIVLFFLAMMFSLVRDHVLPSMSRGGGIDIDRAVLTDSWVNQDDWMSIRFGGATLGYLRNTADKDDLSDGYITTSSVEIKTPFIRGRLVSVIRMNRRLEVETARVRAQAATIGTELLSAKDLDAPELPRGVYEVAAKVSGPILRYRIRHEDDVKFSELRLARPLTVADSLTPILRGGMLNRKASYVADLYNPLDSGAGKVEVEWIDDKTELVDGKAQTLKVVEVRYATMKTKLYVDKDGNVIRREIPLFAGAQSSGGGTVTMEKLEPVAARAAHPELDYVPEPREFTAEELQGTDKGELLKSVSIFSLVGGGLKLQ